MCSKIISTLVFMCLLPNFTLFQENLTRVCKIKCLDEFTNTTSGTAYWKYKGIPYAISEDLLCLKSDHQILMRVCDTNYGRWIPDLIECKIKINKNLHCPDDLFEIRNVGKLPICLKISTEPKAFNEQFCYGSNIIPMDLKSFELSKVSQFLKKMDISEYWLPIRRNNELMPYEVRLPGKSWRKKINRSIIHLKNNPNEHCLKRTISNQTPTDFKSQIVSVDCNAFLNAVCIFKSELISNAGCPSGFGALVYQPAVCYGIDWNNTTSEPLDLKEYLKKRNWLRRILAKYVSKKNRHEFFKIDFFFHHLTEEFVIIMSLSENFQIVSKGLKWIPTLSKKIVKPSSAVEMVLEIDHSSKGLRLVIYNRKYLWGNNSSYAGVKCFAFLKYGTLKNARLNLIWENQEQSYSIFKVNIVSSYRTEYWCEGHSIFDFQLVSTRLFVDVNRNTAPVFVLRWNVSCINANLAHSLCSEVTDKNVRKLVEGIYGNKNLGNLLIYDVRIMDMEWIKNVCVVFWIHITAALKITASIYHKEIAFGDNTPKIPKDFVAFMQIKITLRNFFFNFIKNSTYLIRSTDYCFSELSFSNDGMHLWTTTRVGEIAMTKKLCIQKDGMPYTRYCLGDFVHGAYWKELTQPVVCESPKNNTKVLHDLQVAKMFKSPPDKVLKYLKYTIANSKNNIVPADIFFIYNIIQSVLEVHSSNSAFQQTNKDLTKWKNVLYQIFDIYNILIGLDSKVIKMSAKLNATNKFLKSFEMLCDTLSTYLSFTQIDNGEEYLSDLHSETIDYDDIGVSVYVSKYILYFSINPSIANVSGIALFANNNTEDTHTKLKGAFQNEHYRFLQVNHDINDIVNEPDLELAVYLPIELFGTLKASTNEANDVIVVIKVYSSDELFQQPNRNLTLLSRVASISLPGYSSFLPVPVPLIFRKSTNKGVNPPGSCLIWNYEGWIDGYSMLKYFENNGGIALCLLRRLAPTGYFLEKINSIENHSIHNDLSMNNTKVNGSIICDILLFCSILMVIAFLFCKCIC
ncbi:uncharacterized protein LOC116800889 isoform X1 [Drosophila sechellia]|uniref:uncharacterized protein LOC116800889 isoform X1 n=1 Tax=Drosophila sechellia TaxID=7238 RepID=UPI0013DD8F3E|nr:uncharacterized protein LOC116800889 isoform X1 [Drosophila sechellia]